MKKAKLIESKIKKNSKLKNFITPDYEKYCVSNIPNNVLSILDVKNKRNKIPQKDIKSQTKGIKKVVIFLIDSLPYKDLLKFVAKNKNSIFNKMIKNGEFFPLTSVFPSITPVVLSTYSTGLTPQEHGNVSSSYYHEKIKRVISLLHFTTAEEIPIPLKYEGLKPKDLIKNDNIFEILKKKKIKTFVINYKDFVESDFNKMLYRGSREIPYKKYSNISKSLKKILSKEKKVFVFCYFHKVDETIHEYGIDSKMLFKEMKKISNFFQKFIEKMDKKTAEETLIMLCSDHGQINLSKKKMVFLADHPKIMENLSAVPMGGIRYVFLKLKKNKKSEVKKYIKKKFSKKALVLDINQIEKNKLSGLKKINKRNRQRMGDLLLLPYDNYTFFAPLKEDQSFIKAQHGGLSKQEMIVPFICVKVSNLKD